MPIVFYSKLRKLSNTSLGFTIPSSILSNNDLKHQDFLKVTIEKANIEPIIVPGENKSMSPVNPIMVSAPVFIDVPIEVPDSLVGVEKESAAVIE